MSSIIDRIILNQRIEMKQFFKMLLASCLGVILASAVVFILFFWMLGSAIGGVVNAFKGDQEKVAPIKGKTVLLLDQKGPVSDIPTMDFLMSFGDEESKNFTLPEILRAIEVARENPDVEAVVLKLENASVGFASAKEVRDALKRFKESGKKVYAYADSYSHNQYYVSSVADELYAGPEGIMGIQGISSTTQFNKGLLSKLGVEMQVFKVGTFKGAVEPFIRDNLSAENRLQIQEMVNGYWNGTVAEMSASRSLDPALFQTFADEAMFLDKMENARSLGMIDSLVYRADIDKVLARKIYGDSEARVNYRRVNELLGNEKSVKSDNKVAVIYAEGSIVVGNGEDQSNPFSVDNVIDERLVKQLRNAAEDESIDAVVLRVNSGGGAVTTSELICHEVELLKAKKPIVVSMGNYAASGGYYISSHASAIVANPYTLTGSIGIFGLLPNAKGTADKLGLKYETVATSETGVMNLAAPLNPRLAQEFQVMIERGYDQFITRVATGRNMSKEQVDSIGQGRVWLGSKALELGLVDKLGGLDVAITEAARLAGLEDYRVVQNVDRPNWFKQFFGFNFSVVVDYFTMTQEERLMKQAEQYVKDMSGVRAVPPIDIVYVADRANQSRALELQF